MTTLAINRINYLLIVTIISKIYVGMHKKLFILDIFY